MHGQAQTQVRVLALLYALGGLLSLSSATWPLDPASPVALLRAVGGIGLAAAVTILLVGRRWPAGVVHVGFALMSVLVGLLAARSVTAVGVVGLGPVAIATSLFAAHAFTAAAGRTHVLVLLAAACTGAALSAATNFAVPWLIVPVTAAVVFEVHGHLLRRQGALAAADPLTGVANRRHWEACAARDLAQAQRSGRPLSVVIIDLDGFKQVNDSRGHAAGDALLRELTSCWQRELRRADLLGRWGGDEFVVCLPGASGRDAEVLLERLHGSHPMAWSAGCATSSDGDELAGLLAHADADLYQHKRSRVRSAT